MSKNTMKPIKDYVISYQQNSAKKTSEQGYAIYLYVICKNEESKAAVMHPALLLSHIATV